MSHHKTLSSVAFALMAFSMANAYAAPPVAELKVKGQLVVPVCTVAASDDGVYDFGKQSATLVKPNAYTNLTPMVKTWTVTCDAETYLNLTPTDNRADSTSAVANANFGLGKVNTDGKIGYYTATMSKATVDNTSTSLFSTRNNVIASADVAATTAIATGGRSGWAASSTTQKSGKVFSADITVQPYLASSAIMQGPITDDTNLDGSLTLSFAYGI